MDIEVGRWVLFSNEVLNSSKKEPKVCKPGEWKVQLADGRWVTEHGMRQHAMFYLNHHCDGGNCTLTPAYGSVYLLTHEPITAGEFLRIDYFAANKVIGGNEMPWFKCNCGSETCFGTLQKRTHTISQWQADGRQAAAAKQARTNTPLP